ncbi:MAG: ABC transporter ATP-binding protein [Rhodobacteraceae bacterium]|nr:ABC transporter ATP-binding protein [Paracoccaceae bacterium]
MSVGPVLSLRDVSVSVPGRGARGARALAVDRVSVDIAAGEVLGIVGESGAGKSLLASAVTGLLPPRAGLSGGEVWIAGARVDHLPEARLRRLRGRVVGTVFQDPLGALNPLMTIGAQLAETIAVHLPLSRSAARQRAAEALAEVGIPAPADRLGCYPHELSGGMRQRVGIALALCAAPALLIADEPTTALDVSVQAQILALLKRLCRDRGMAVMLITHDMGVIAETADRIAVLYAGRLVETGPVRDVLDTPCHPYTDGLVAAVPRIDGRPGRLAQIPGAMPPPGARPAGCAFHPRCALARDRCRKDPAPEVAAAGGRAACWFPCRSLPARTDP